jgi:hypothetical protein
VPRALAAVPDLDRELEQLYALPPEEFTGARNDLATRLRKAGQAEASERVRALRKPSVPVWAVNQLARQYPDAVAKLLEAGERLRRAQEAAFRGDSGEAVREATAAERAAVRALTQHAQSLLRAEERNPTRAVLDRIASTLRAAAVEPEAAPLLAAGRLAGEIGSSGFATVAELAPPVPKRQRTQRAKDEGAARRREQELRKVRARVQRLERRAAEEEERAEWAEQAAGVARERAEKAKAEAAEARAELDDLA